MSGYFYINIKYISLAPNFYVTLINVLLKVDTKYLTSIISDIN